ncbi:MAG: hypothetical protein MJY87_02405 [Fibrobacter sp.]|nr:hypothetical protein [Fibrobacter sp.]
MAEVLDAISGEWGDGMQDGLRIVRIGRVSLLQGIFGESAVTVGIPVAERRFAAYFHDTHGNVNMAIVEAGAKFVKRPENIRGGFSFFAMV